MPYQVIIQYVPDSVTDERINIGVSVLADGKAVTHFLTDWTRVRNFANRDVSFLKDLVHESKKWDECTVRRLSKCWLGTIQFSEPMGTLLPPEEALLDGLRRYLFERTIETRGYRDKCTLVTSVRKNVRSVLGQFWGAKGKALLKCKEVAIAAGEPSPYQFDIPVANGRPYFAVQGVSFEGPENKALGKEIWSTAWLILNVRKQIPDFPIGVVVAPPLLAVHGDMYSKATTEFERLGADVMRESEILEWTSDKARKLTPYLCSTF